MPTQMLAGVPLLGTGPQGNRAGQGRLTRMAALRVVRRQSAEEGREDKAPREIRNGAIASNLVRGRALMLEDRSRDWWRPLTDIHSPARSDHVVDGRHHAGWLGSLSATACLGASAG